MEPWSAEPDIVCPNCGSIYGMRSQPSELTVTTDMACLVCGVAIRSIVAKKVIQYAIKIPPRRITHEHESAHVVVGHVGKATIKHINLTITASQDNIQLAHAAWSPFGADTNAISLAYAAGPAQTQITVRRLGFGDYLAAKAIDAESATLAPLLKCDRANGVRYLRAYLPATQTYLEMADVQAAVQEIANLLEKAEQDGRTQIDWVEIEDVIDWNKLPPLPRI